MGVGSFFKEISILPLVQFELIFLSQKLKNRYLDAFFTVCPNIKQHEKADWDRKGERKRKIETLRQRGRAWSSASL